MSPEDEKELHTLVGQIQGQKFDDLPTGMPPEAQASFPAAVDPPPTPTRTVSAINPSAGPAASSDSPPSELAVALKGIHPGAAPAADDGLEDARASSRRSQSLGLIGRAMTNFNSAVAGRDLGQGFWDQRDKQAEQPVKDILAGREEAFTARERANKLRGEDRNEARTVAAGDPNSSMNQNGARFWTKTFGLDRDAAGQPRDAAEVESDTQALAKILAEHPDDKLEAVKMLEHFKEARAAKKAAVDKGAEDEKTKQGIVDTVMRSYREKYGKELTPDVETALRSGTKENAEKLLSNLQARETAEIGARKAVSGERQASVAEQGLGIQKSQLTVPGFQPDLGPKGQPVHTPTSGQADELTEMRSASERVHSLTKRLKDLYQQHGHALPGSTAFAELKAIRGELIPTVAKAGGFGTLTSGHQELLGDVLPEPNALQNFINSGKFPALLDELDHGVDVAVSARARSLGQHPTAPEAPAPVIPKGNVHVRRKSDGQMGFLASDSPRIKSGEFEVVSGGP